MKTLTILFSLFFFQAAWSNVNYSIVQSTLNSQEQASLVKITGDSQVNVGADHAWWITQGGGYLVANGNHHIMNTSCSQLASRNQERLKLYAHAQIQCRISTVSLRGPHTPSDLRYAGQNFRVAFYSNQRANIHDVFLTELKKVVEHMNLNSEAPFFGGRDVLDLATKARDSLNIAIVKMYSKNRKQVNSLVAHLQLLLDSTKRLSLNIPLAYWEDQGKAFQEVIEKENKVIHDFLKDNPNLAGNTYPAHRKIVASIRHVYAFYSVYQQNLDGLINEGEEFGVAKSEIKLNVENIKFSMAKLNNQYGLEGDEGPQYGFLYGTVAVDIVDQLLNIVSSSERQEKLTELKRTLATIVAISKGSNDVAAQSFVQDLVDFWQTEAWQKISQDIVASRNQNLIEKFLKLQEVCEKMAFMPHQMSLN